MSAIGWAARFFFDTWAARFAGEPLGLYVSAPVPVRGGRCDRKVTFRRAPRTRRTRT
jgi:hypothetical protein